MKGLLCGIKDGQKQPLITAAGEAQAAGEGQPPIHGKEVIPLYRPPAAYTGELLGVEYLYHQSGEDELVGQIDEGFGELYIQCFQLSLAIFYYSPNFADMTLQLF